MTRCTFTNCRANLNGPIRKILIVFLLKPIRGNFVPGFPRAHPPWLSCAEELWDRDWGKWGWQVGNSSTCAAGYILCVEKTGCELFYQFRPHAGLPKMADDRTSRVCDVCKRLLCQSIAIDERFLSGYRLIID